MDSVEMAICTEKSLELLIAKRYHGATSIRGFNYQILYSIYLALVELPLTNGEITLEGIEDIDSIPNLVGVISKALNVQVKYRTNGLNWTEFNDILCSFATVFCIDPNRGLRIVTNNKVRPSVTKFLQSLYNTEVNDKKLRNKLISAGVQQSQLREFYKCIDLRIVQAECLEQECINKIIQLTECSTETAHLNLESLTAFFYQCAAKRVTLTFDDMQNHLNKVLETLSTNAYDAFGLGLIERIKWGKKGDLQQFYGGSSVLPGDIEAGLDVIRNEWLQEIRQAYEKEQCIVVKAPSGQGKTVLLLRYAYEHGNIESTFIINQLATETDVVSVRRYLEAIDNVGISTLVLMDDINNRLCMWAKLISGSRLQNVQFLISTREDNWHYFVSHDTQYELIDLNFSRKEAENMYKVLKSRGYVFDSQLTASDVYDLLGKPPLLLEYVYLATQGEILKKRLTDQLQNIMMNSSIALQIIRLVSLADIVGARISLEQLQKLSSHDIESTLRGLTGEYVRIEAGIVSGLHVVRSRHIVKILHDTVYPISNTISRLFAIFHSSQLTMLVRYLITEQQLTICELNQILVELKDLHALEDIVAMVDALYQVGIDRYVNNNQQMIKASFDFIGISGVSILLYGLMQKHDSDDYESVFDVFPDKPNFQRLKQISLSEDKSYTGNEYVYDFLKSLRLSNYAFNYKYLGELLEWCNLTKSKIWDWADYSNKCIISVDYNSLEFNDLCQYTYGLYLYSKETYNSFMRLNKHKMLSYIKLNLDCYDIEFTDNTITIKFISHLSEYNDIGNQAVPRLTKLYYLFPYFQEYVSEPFEPIMKGLTPSHSNNNKRMLPKYIQREAEIYRNRLLITKCLQIVIPNVTSFVDDYWQSLRWNSYIFTKEYTSYLVAHYKGYKCHSHKVDHIIELCNTIINSLNITPLTVGLEKHSNFNERIKGLLGSLELQKWSTSLNNFYTQLVSFLGAKGQSITLCLYNLNESYNELPSVHNFFDRQYEKYGVCYNHEIEGVDEINTYKALHNMLTLKYVMCYKGILEDPIGYMESHIREKGAKEITNIKNFFNDMGLITGTNLYIEDTLSYLPIQYECTSPDTHFDDVIQAMESAASFDYPNIHGFWFVPVFNGRMFMPDGYMMFSETLQRSIKDTSSIKWEMFMPRTIPPYVKGLLPCGSLEMFDIAPPPISEEMKSGLIKATQTCFSELLSSLPENDRYEIELKNRYYSRLKDRIDEIHSI